MSDQTKPRGVYVVHVLDTDQDFPGLADRLRTQFAGLGWKIEVEEIPDVTGVGAGFFPDAEATISLVEMDRWTAWVNHIVLQVCEAY